MTLQVALVTIGRYCVTVRIFEFECNVCNVNNVCIPTCGVLFSCFHDQHMVRSVLIEPKMSSGGHRAAEWLRLVALTFRCRNCGSAGWRKLITIVRRLWEIVGGNSLMNVGLNTIFYVGQLIWAGFLTLRWIDGQTTHFSI